MSLSKRGLLLKRLRAHKKNLNQQERNLRTEGRDQLADKYQKDSALIFDAIDMIESMKQVLKDVRP